MLLAIDVGNTNIMFGIFAGEKVKACWRVATHREQTEDELGMVIKNLLQHGGIDSQEVSAIAISSVVPPLMYSLEKMARKYFSLEPLVVGPGIKTGLNIMMDNPREVGADRIVNAVAGYTLYGGPLIIVDFGTATTFCAVSAQEIISVERSPRYRYHGSLKRLPSALVEMVKPRRVIGKDTISSIQSGILWFVGQVDGIAADVPRAGCNTQSNRKGFTPDCPGIRIY